MTESELKKKCMLSEILFLTMSEYFLQPTIWRLQVPSDQQKMNVASISTPVLESIYVMIHFLQLENQLFKQNSDIKSHGLNSNNNLFIPGKPNMCMYNFDENFNHLISI